MSKTKITAPVAGYSGRGPGGTVFEDGVGYTDDEAAINYFRAAGYGVGSDKPRDDSQDRIDAREVADVEVVGTRLRDAAVDPEPEDFLPPTNAGEADPHGPLVVAPGIHAIESQVVRPGVVHVGEPGKQEKAETDQARKLLVENAPAGDVVPDDTDRGPLEMSDPGSADVGVENAKKVEAQAPAAPTKTAAKKATRKSAKKS